MRLALLAALLAFLFWCAYRPKRTMEVVRAYFFRKSGPISLAVARILVFLILFNSMRLAQLQYILRLPQVFREYPIGWGWMRSSVPLFEPWFAHSVHWLGMTTALMASLGLLSRVAAPLAALSAIYVLGLEHFFFKIHHDGQALIWIALILSLSRSNQALSLDALIQTARKGAPRFSMPTQPECGYSLPLRLCWLGFGIAYFFPGLFKTVDAGDLWINGTAIRAKVIGALIERPDFDQVFPLQDYPTLCMFFGLGTLLFELGFVFTLFSKRRWWLAPVVGASFHLGVLGTMGISFLSMLQLYFIFIDFDALAKKVTGPSSKVGQHLGISEATSHDSIRSSAPRLFPVAVFGGALLLLNIYTGFERINSWPFSNYPLFSSRKVNPEGIGSHYELWIKHRDGSSNEVTQDRFPKFLGDARWTSMAREFVAARGELAREYGLGFAELARMSEYTVRRGDVLEIDRSKYRLRDGKRERFHREAAAGLKMDRAPETPTRLESSAGSQYR